MRANMRTASVTQASVTSSLLEIVRSLVHTYMHKQTYKIICFTCPLNMILCEPLHSQVESSDLIAYGLIPEFVGRFPILVNLSALTEDQLVQVIFVFSGANL